MARAELLSTTLGGSDKSLGTLDVAALHRHCRDATRVTVVSAFYDRAFLMVRLGARWRLRPPSRGQGRVCSLVDPEVPSVARL